MKFVVRAVAVAATLTVAGCGKLPGASLINTFLVEPFLGVTVPGAEGLNGPGEIFSATLGREYQALARVAAEEHVNWIDASAYAQKGRAALLGELVEPWAPSAFGLTGEAETAYGAINEALAMHGGRNPVACARSQALYDAYIEALSEGDHSCADPALLYGELQESMEACSFAKQGFKKMTIPYGEPLPPGAIPMEMPAPAAMIEPAEIRVPAPVVVSEPVFVAQPAVSQPVIQYSEPVAAEVQAYDACVFVDIPSDCSCTTASNGNAVVSCMRCEGGCSN